MKTNKRFVYNDLSRADLHKLLTDGGFKEANDPRWLDAIINFLHTKICRVEINDCDDQYYVTLHSDILGHLYGKRKKTDGLYYSRLIEILKKLDVIEADNKFEIGKYSKKYRIHPRYVGVIIEETINLESINYLEEKLSLRGQRHRENVKRLSFDVTKANEVVERLHLSKRLSLTSWTNRWSNGDVTVTEDNNGRIYSNLTGLNKEFRQCLSYQGKDLYSVDLKQAHHYLFLHVLEQRLKQYSKKTLRDFSQTKGHEDVARYINDVCTRDFKPGIYTQILKNKKTVERSELKVGILAEVYYQRIKKNKHKIAKAFSDLYPTVWVYIQAIKKKNHRDLARKLLYQESKLMNRALDRLYKNHPHDLFIRLHDAIITTEDMVAITEDAIKQAGRDLIGWQPMVESTKFNVQKGEIADHELSFYELQHQFTEDLKKDLWDRTDKLEIAVYQKNSTWSEFAIKQAQKLDTINKENFERWMKQAHFLRFPTNKINTTLSFDELVRLRTGNKL